MNLGSDFVISNINWKELTMNEFGMVILCIMGIGTLSIVLNIYLAYHINRLERENEHLKVRNQYRIIERK